MNWKLKAKAFRMLSAVPFGRQVHYVVQRYVTKSLPRSDAAIAEYLEMARRVKREIEAAGVIAFQGARLLEIGAGRDFATAIALRMLGAGSVTCVDITHMARPILVAAAARRIAALLGQPDPGLDDWRKIKSFGITYLAPTLLQHAEIAKASIDCFYTVATLEHIPPSDLEDVLAYSSKLLSPGGLSVHIVDYTDHYARHGNGLPLFNFLTFDEGSWKPYNSDYQYVNRLRHSQVLGMFERTGMKILRHDPKVAKPEPQVTSRLAAEFAHLQPDDLFTIEGTIVARHAMP